MSTRHSLTTTVAACGMALAASLTMARAEFPTVLSDKIMKGEGAINLLKDIAASDLKNYLDANKSLILAVDANESAEGNESRNSVGVGIKQMQLIIKTTTGTYTFNDVFTSTSAMIRESDSSAAREFYTLFGINGSSQITGNSDAIHFDDVVQIRNVNVAGSILSAHLEVKFIDTAQTRIQNNESFFDYSGGFEQFAIVSARQANTIEGANSGVADAPSSISYKTTPIAYNTVPGSPVPPLVAVAALGTLIILRRHG